MAGEFVFIGGAFIAAAGSTVLVCVTATAAAQGQKTPIDITDKYYDTHFGDIVGWAMGEYPAVRHPKRRPAASQTQAGTEADSLTSSSRAPRTELEEDKKKRYGRIYVTYRKFNEKTLRYYSGRTSMLIDLSKDHLTQAAFAVAVRDSNHHIDEPAEPRDDAFLDAQVDEFDVGTALDYSQRYNDIAYHRSRGREQQLIDFHGGAWSDTGKPYRTENAIRGVAKDNKQGLDFHKKATDFWKEELHPYTGY